MAKRGALAVMTAAGLVLAVSAAGCTGGGGATTGASGPPPRTGSSDINEKPRDALKKGGTLRLSIQQWITQYNVGQVDGLQGDGQTILELTQPMLWFNGDKGVPQRTPVVFVLVVVFVLCLVLVVTYT